MENRNSPHQGGDILATGAALDEAKGVVVLIHGRGASASSILELSGVLGGDGLAYLAPQAAGHSWYPQSFLAPIEQNEPGLSSGL